MAAKPGKIFRKGVAANPKGRPKGSLSKFQIKTAERVEATGITPLDFLLVVMRRDVKKLMALGIRASEVDLYTRMQAAEAALPYCHRRMPPQPAPDGEVDPNTIAAKISIALKAMEQISGGSEDGTE